MITDRKGETKKAEPFLALPYLAPISTWKALLRKYVSPPILILLRIIEEYPRFGDLRQVLMTEKHGFVCPGLIQRELIKGMGANFGNPIYQAYEAALSWRNYIYCMRLHHETFPSARHFRNLVVSTPVHVMHGGCWERP